MAKGDKAAREAEARAKHIQERNEAKARRRAEPALVRAEPIKEELPKILIVCEGRNTEPTYFEQFKLTSARVVVLGKGYNTLSLVRQTEQLSQRDTYEKVWCVFDKDDFSAQDFNNAITVAEGLNFGVAYSNQSFEYWLILHFDDHQGGGMHRRDYHDKINALLKQYDIEYEGEDSKKVTEDMFDLMLENDERTGRRRLDLAILRAERNYNLFDHQNPASEESSTTVFRLATELLKYV